MKGNSDNRISFASFDPNGDKFVAIYGETSEPERNNLWFHDGKTGMRVPGESLDMHAAVDATAPDRYASAQTLSPPGRA